MLKIWGRKNSLNVVKVLWCADELKLAYEQIDAGMEHGKNKEAFFLEMNPNGLVPTIKDNDFVLWESNVIVRYLSKQYGAGTLCPNDFKQRWTADCWMDWQATTLWYNFRPAFMGLVRTPPEQRDQKSIDESIKKTADLLSILDKHFSKQVYIAGEKFTMGDIPIGVTVHRWMSIPIQRRSMNYLETWYKRLCERPAFQKNVMQPF